MHIQTQVKSTVASHDHACCQSCSFVSSIYMVLSSIPHRTSVDSAVYMVMAHVVQLRSLLLTQFIYACIHTLVNCQSNYKVTLQCSCMCMGSHKLLSPYMMNNLCKSLVDCFQVSDSLPMLRCSLQGHSTCSYSAIF